MTTKKTQSKTRGSSEAGSDADNRYADFCAMALKHWRIASAVLNDPERTDAVNTGLNTIPEFYEALLPKNWGTLVQFQQQVWDRLGKIGSKTGASNFAPPDQDLFKMWKEVYEENFRRYLSIPQLGLMRYYQERFNRYVDQSNLLQTSLSEFMFMLYLPMEKSFLVLQDKVEELSKEGKPLEGAKEYYNLWLKILESHYTDFFKSPEYLDSLRNTLNQLEAYSTAKDQLLQDILRVLPVPTTEEMDDMYKDFYMLRKKLKTLESRVLTLEKSKQAGTGKA